MSLVELLAHPACRLFTLALLHFLWQGFAIAAALVLIVELGGIRRAGRRYACSLSAFFVMAACPLFTLAWLAVEGAGLRGLSAIANSDELTSGSMHSRELASRVQLHWPVAASLEAVQPYALACWLLGVVLFGGRLTAGALGLAQLRRGRQPLPPQVAEMVSQLGQRLALEAMPMVFLSRQVAEAMAIGVIRPLVLIPAAWATEMPLPMLQAVIAHELAHLRRRDLWVNLLQRCVETLLFYHPAVWWLSRRLRIERELCADELAVAATGNPLIYAQALEQVARWRRAEIRPALAAFLQGEEKMCLLERVRTVLGLSNAERSRLWPAGLIALLLPLGLWIVSAGLPKAVADDEREREKPALERERNENRNNRRVEIRFSGDQEEREEARTSRQQLEQRDPERDRPRTEVRRDGEARKEGSRDEPVEEAIERKVIRRGTAERGRASGEGGYGGGYGGSYGEGGYGSGGYGGYGAIRERSERDAGDARLDELTALVRRLSAQVERLQDEVAALRDDQRREPPKAATYRRSKGYADDEGRGEAEVRERKLREAAEQQDRASLHRERERAERVRAEARESETRAVAEKIRAQAEKQVAEARAMAEKAAAQAREHAEKAAAQARQLAEQSKAEALEAVKRAIERKKEAQLEASKPDKEKPSKEKPDKNQERKDDDDAA